MGLQEAGLLDIVLEGCKQTGLSMQEYVRKCLHAEVTQEKVYEIDGTNDKYNSSEYLRKCWPYSSEDTRRDMAKIVRLIKMQDKHPASEDSIREVKMIHLMEDIYADFD